MRNVSAMMARRATVADAGLILRDFDPGAARQIRLSPPLWEEPSENPDRAEACQ